MKGGTKTAEQGVHKSTLSRARFVPDRLSGFASNANGSALCLAGGYSKEDVENTLSSREEVGQGFLCSHNCTEGKDEPCQRMRDGICRYPMVEILPQTMRKASKVQDEEQRSELGTTYNTTEVDRKLR